MIFFNALYYWLIAKEKQEQGKNPTVSGIHGGRVERPIELKFHYSVCRVPWKKYYFRPFLCRQPNMRALISAFSSPLLFGLAASI